MKSKLVRFLYIITSLLTFLAQVFTFKVIKYIFKTDYISALFNIPYIWILGGVVFVLLRNIRQLDTEIKKGAI